MYMEENSKLMDATHTQIYIIKKNLEEISQSLMQNYQMKEKKQKELFHHIMDSVMNKILWDMSIDY